MKYTIILFTGYAIGLCTHRYWFMPDEIDKRAKEYGLMRYDSKMNKMTVKDSSAFDDYTLQYLKYGTTKK